MHRTIVFLVGGIVQHEVLYFQPACRLYFLFNFIL